MVLELMDCFELPIGADEIDVTVNPGDVLPCGGEPGDADINEILLQPDFRVGADLDVTGIHWVSYFKFTVAKAPLYDVEVGSVLAHPFHKVPEELGSSFETFGVSHYGDDVEIFQQMFVLLG